VHEAPLLNYLKDTGIKVGLLVNMKYPKVKIKRMVFELPEGPDPFLAEQACPPSRA
jgi:hypothetical protein